MLSGPEKFVEWVQDQFEEIRLIAEDSSSAQLLSITIVTNNRALKLVEIDIFIFLRGYT